MKSLFAIVLLFCFFNSWSQQFGAFPPNTQWKQINTDTARIIFTGDATAQAERIATIIHRMAKGTPDPMGNDIRKINIVLHSHTTLANGYVGLGPFRSEYYLIPGGNIFDMGNTPWPEQLAVHEYRHVQQYSHFNNGVSKVFHYLFGQQGQALANAIAIPDWFFEGDAVHAETALTMQGRGRLPYFLNAFNSLWQDGKKYSWMKLRNGSYKDYVPNHYNLGYLLVNYGYAAYGPQFWEKVTKDASAFKHPIYPFQKAVKRYAGVSYKQFRKEALNYYQRPDSIVKHMNQHQPYNNYYFPQYIGSDSLLYLKTSYQQIPFFVIKDENGEHIIRQKDIGSEEWFSCRKNIIAYTAYSTDARWSLQDYSDIVLLDIKTKKERRLTKHSRYFTPDIAPDGKKLVSICMNDSLQTELHLLDMDSGRIIKKVTAADNAFYSNPRFINDSTIVTSLRLPNGDMTLLQINILSDNIESLLPPSPNTIGYPFAKSDTLYFTATFKGNDDIYALSLKNKKLFRLTNGYTGNYYAHIHNDTITWSQFTSHGLQWKQQAVKNLLWQLIDSSKLNTSNNIYKVADAKINILQTPTRNFPARSYSKSFGLLNFHSWQPDYTAPEYTITALSNNILNTLNGEAYYTYNENEKSHTTGVNAIYGGWFPVLRVGAHYTYHRHINSRNRVLLLNQYELRGGYYIPLDFSKGRTYKRLTFGSDWVYNQRLPADDFKDILPKQSTTYLSHFISWRQQLPMAVQQIYPKLGYATYFNFQHRLQHAGYQFLNNTAVYLPSLFRNHSIVLSASFQQTDTCNIVFSNQFVNARGYADVYDAKMMRLSANYHFPIAYPDWGFANIFYLLRLRANLFFDYSKTYEVKRPQNHILRSTGAELYFDTKWWNQLPVSIGIRYSYLLNANSTNRSVMEVVFPTLIP